MAYHFFIEEHNHTFFLKKDDTEKINIWLHELQKHYRVSISYINYIFCNDSFLLALNQTHLDHDTLTDIITFQYCHNPIEGEIYISTERVKDNAMTYNISFDQELRRVIAHGFLHLVGFTDKKEEQKKEMTNQENITLSIYSQLNQNCST